MELVVTAPGVAYEIMLTDGNSAVIDNPGKLPSRDKIREIREAGRSGDGRHAVRVVWEN